MKKTFQKPLMLAYIFFLSICVIWHIICRLTGLSFETWNKIIVAATFASFFFSLCSIYKLKHQQEKKNRELFSEELDLLSKIKNKLTKDKHEATLNGINQLLENCNESLPKAEEAIQKYTRRAFGCDVLGYLSFFIIVGIDGVYEYLSRSADSITLLAFLAILIIEYLENTIIVKFEDSRKNLREKTREFLTLLEEAPANLSNHS